MPLDSLKQQLVGEWTSLSIEVRPSRNPDGTIKPFYLTRDFRYLADDRFELTIVNFADAGGKVPLVRIGIAGYMQWRGEHAVRTGARQVDFVADTAYTVTPLAQGFVDVLNRVAANGYAPWTVGGTQSILGRSFAPFGLVAGKDFMEFDLVCLDHDLLFWGARHVDGRGFDSEANRPTSLQIPMARR